MPRPFKRRQVQFLPEFTSFKPQGVPARRLSAITLTFDELEALRLKDLEGMDQSEIAAQMDVSQSTVQRILTSARQKVAEAIVRGRVLQIEGGQFDVARNPMRQFRCGRCRHVWEVAYGTGQSGREMNCPACESDVVHRTEASQPDSSGVDPEAEVNQERGTS